MKAEKSLATVQVIGWALGGRTTMDIMKQRTSRPRLLGKTVEVGMVRRVCGSSEALRRGALPGGSGPSEIIRLESIEARGVSTSYDWRGCETSDGRDSDSSR
jgi:hypothetical protein